MSPRACVLSLLGLALTHAPLVWSQDQGVVAQVVLVIEQRADAATLQALTAEDRASLAQAGIEVDEPARALRLRPRPLAGYYVRIGDERYPTDANGFLRLPKAPVAVTNVKVYAQVYDTKVFGTLPRLIVVPEGQVPQPSTLKLSFKRPKPTTNTGGPVASGRAPGTGRALAGLPTHRHAVLASLDHSELLEHASLLFQPSPPPDFSPACRALALFLVVLGPMNPTEVAAGGCARMPCPPPGPAVNALGCCLDYNGPHLDAKPYNRGAGPACMAKGICNFLGSTCYEWSFLKANTPCGNEGALPWNRGGPTCYNNHKYRNCQALDETAFSFTPSSSAIEFNDSVELEVTNNTPKNATCLQVSGGPGQPKLKLRPGYGKLTMDKKKCRGYRLDHFSDAAKHHFETLSLEFIAPKAPANTCRAEYKVVAEAGSLTQKAEITATGGGCATAHLELALEGSEPIDRDRSHPSPPYSGRLTGTETSSYRAVIDLKAEEDASSTLIRFLPVSGNASASWRFSETEQGEGQNFQGCRYRKTYTSEITLSGTRDVRDEARDRLSQWGTTLYLDADGSYSLAVPAPSVRMEGTDRLHHATTVLTDTCTGGGSTDRTNDREEDMSVSVEAIRGTLPTPSTRSVTGSRPVTFDLGLGPPMTGTLSWRITW
jgi:hypothetical protein